MLDIFRRAVTWWLIPTVITSIFVIFYILVMQPKIDEIINFAWLTFLITLLVIGLPILLSGIKIIPEYERAAVLRLGRYIGMLGPGLVFIDAVLDRVFRFDLRVQTIDIPSQEVLTKDNVNIKVDAVIVYRIVDPGKVFISVSDVKRLLFQYGQANLREVLGVHELDEILQKREEMAKLIQEELDKMIGEWGIKVISVALQQIYLPENMIRALAMQAEAERERRAKVISAEGEKQAASIMAEAAKYYMEHPIALRLRELTTLVEVAKERNLVVLYPITFGSLEQTSIASLSLALTDLRAKKSKTE